MELSWLPSLVELSEVELSRVECLVSLARFG